MVKPYAEPMRNATTSGLLWARGKLLFHLVLFRLPPSSEGDVDALQVTSVHASRTYNLWHNPHGAGNASCTQHVPLDSTARRKCGIHGPPFCFQALLPLQLHHLPLQLHHLAREEPLARQVPAKARISQNISGCSQCGNVVGGCLFCACARPRRPLSTPAKSLKHCCWCH